MNKSNLTTLNSYHNKTSLTKLTKTVSQNRFRIKSLSQSKTTSLSKHQCINGLNYQQELNNNHYTKQFLTQLFVTKFHNSKIVNVTHNSMYQSYVKSLYQRLLKTNTIQLAKCNFNKQSAQLFFNSFIHLNKNIICYNLSQCPYLLHAKSRTNKQWIISHIIKTDKKIIKLLLRNMELSSQQLTKIFTTIIQTQKIYELDLSNQNSQSMNKFGQSIQILGNFVQNNATVAILKLDNMNLSKVGVDEIYRGISSNRQNPLKILTLKNNSITQHSFLPLTSIVRSGLIHLDLSQNSLGSKFYLNLPSWKQSTIKYLNISNTNMNSQSLIYFMNAVQDNYVLEMLKVDRNDFSHHWFNQIKQSIQGNKSILFLSLCDCKIKRTNQFFNGLTYNKYLKKLNISNNQIQEGVNQLCRMLKQNKIINQLKIKSCGLKSNDFVNIFQSLSKNHSLNLLDISENQVGENSGKQLLKLLTTNQNITTMLLDKVQISYTTKQELQKKLANNRQLKKKQQILHLKKQNIQVKQSDTHTWQDIDNTQKMIKKNYYYLDQLHAQLNLLEKQYRVKKQQFQQVEKEYKGEQATLINNIEDLKTKIKNIHLQQLTLIKQYQLQQSNLHNTIKQQQQSINHLQQSILHQNLKNQARQNQLQDQYQNIKYIQKRNQRKKQRYYQKIQNDLHREKGLRSRRKSKNF